MMFIFRLNSILKIFLTLFLFLIFLMYNIVSPEIIFADEGQSVMEMDGWTKNPKLEPLKPFPWDVACTYFSINFILYTASTFFWATTYCDVGVQTEALSIINENTVSFTEALSILTVSDSPINTVSTLLSGTPSIPGTEDFYLKFLLLFDLQF